jgi:hypothetical protein
MTFVRYGIPLILIVLGVLALFVGPDGAHLEGWAMFTGAGLSVLLLNVLYRVGVSGDSERDQESEARDFYDRHGRWPDEPEKPRDRSWSLPMNVATPESEAAEAAARADRRDAGSGEAAEDAPPPPGSRPR